MDAPDCLWGAGIPSGARLLGCLLWAQVRPGEEPFAAVSSADLATKLGMSRQAIHKHMASLMVTGLTKRGRKEIGGRFFDGWHLSTTVDALSTTVDTVSTTVDITSTTVDRPSATVDIVSTTVDKRPENGSVSADPAICYLEDKNNVSREACSVVLSSEALGLVGVRPRKRRTTTSTTTKTVRPRTRMWETPEAMLASLDPKGRPYSEVLAEEYVGVDILHEVERAYGHVSIQSKTDHVTYVRNWLRNSVKWGTASLLRAPAAERRDRHGNPVVLPPGRAWTPKDEMMLLEGAVWRDGGWT